MNLTTAAAQYANRPADERFASVADLVANAEHDRALSKEVDYNLKDLRIDGADSQITLVSPRGKAHFSHWSFGQFSRMVGAPAAYLRTLPTAIAADALNYGIGQTPTGDRASFLVKAANGNPLPLVRCATSDSYARVWDAPLYSQVLDTIVSRDSRWQLPPTWKGGADGPRAGAYRGDRDSFLILVNGGSIVNDPSARGDGTMYRALMIRNSEVGASSIQISEILYRFICGNHIIWGAVMDRLFRRRHVGKRVTADTVRELGRFAQQYVHQSTERDNAIINALISNDVATTKQGVIDELQALGATKADATAAYDRAEQTEINPRSYWGAVQGLTRVSQDSLYQDERLTMDQLAAKLLAKGAQKFAYAA